jgi:hypothetical protein
MCPPRRLWRVSTDREAFLAGERPTDVHAFLHEGAVSNVETLESHGERVKDGVVLVLDGDEARGIFQRATGIDPMALAREAMGTEGDIDADCAGGICPACGADPNFVFAFAEEQNEEAGGLYAEGAVIHAYAVCECGERYTEKWVASER